MDSVINGLLNIDPSVYGLLLGGAVGVSLLTQGAKKLFALTNEKHVIAVFNLIAIAASGLDYFLSSSHLPPTVLGINTLLLTGVASPVYIYFIKPLSIFIADVKLYKSRVLEKVNEVATTSGVAPIIEDVSTPEPVVTTPVIETQPVVEVIPSVPTADF